MKTIDVESIKKDPVKRMQFFESFTCFTEEDWKALQDSIEVLGPKLPTLLDSIYEHLLSFDDTKKALLGKEKNVDPHYIEIRKEHLTQWLLRTVHSKKREELAHYLVSVGHSHTGKGGEVERTVAPRYIVGLTSFIQTAFLSTLFELLPENPKEALRLGLAWNKMMLIQLEMLLKVIAPHWPNWDEA